MRDQPRTGVSFPPWVHEDLDVAAARYLAGCPLLARKDPLRYFGPAESSCEQTDYKPEVTDTIVALLQTIDVEAGEATAVDYLTTAEVA